MQMMRHWVIIKKKEDGKESMVMFFGIQSTSLCLLQPLVLAPNYSFCQYLFTTVFCFVLFFVIMELDFACR